MRPRQTIWEIDAAVLKVSQKLQGKGHKAHEVSVVRTVGDIESKLHAVPTLYTKGCLDVVLNRLSFADAPRKLLVPLCPLRGKNEPPLVELCFSLGVFPRQELMRDRVIELQKRG